MPPLAVMLQPLWALLATLGFCVVFRVPPGDMPLASVGGALSWAVYLAVGFVSGVDSLAYFSASVAVGLYSEAVAVLRRRPATLFIITAIIPLVPGAGMYRSMLEAVSGAAQASASTLFLTLTAAGAIAGGLAVASALARIVVIRPQLHDRPADGTVARHGAGRGQS